MELKGYQRRALDNLQNYLVAYAKHEDAAAAYDSYLADDGLAAGKDGIPRYVDELGGAPKVCLKVPTGGGKTFMAANAVRLICDSLPPRPHDVVVWLVPRTEILKQTLRQMRDPSHPLRMALDRDFAHRVEVLDKEEALYGRGLNPAAMGEQLTVFVLSYDSFKNKDGRRAYAENAALAQLTGYQRKTGQAVAVEGADDTALISALAGTRPIVIVDESHHARSTLSIEMLHNLNPRFVLELTATPRKGSNVIARVSARELKDEQMVKLPVIVYRRHDKREVVQDAVLLQRKLEMIATDEQTRGGEYIRPIALLQAEARGTDDAETYEKLQQQLVEAGVPAEQIAVRTGDRDELGSTDLMSPACPIRFVVTVEALAEGWDCPFAYILASVANKTSKTSVEQVVGRILRQPYAHRSAARSLNISYVLTSSDDFNATIDQVVEGLNGAGFSKRDMVANKMGALEGAPAATYPGDGVEPGRNECDKPESDFRPTFPDTQPVTPACIDDGMGSRRADGTEPSEPGRGLNPLPDYRTMPSTDSPRSAIDQMIRQAENSERAFEEPAGASGSQREGAGNTGLGDSDRANRIRPVLAGGVKGLLLPQFRLHVSAGIFSSALTQRFERRLLLSKFNLESCSTSDVVFDIDGNDDARQIDVDDESDELKVRQLARRQVQDMHELFTSYSGESKRHAVIDGLVGLMSAQFLDTYGMKGARDFVSRSVTQMTPEQIDSYLDNAPRYAKAIASAVAIQARAYCKTQFYKRLNQDIVVEPAYALPEFMVARNGTTLYDHTLYQAEPGNMNDLERKMADVLSNSERILWWHRVDERRRGEEFCINGFINHYPDFIAMTHDGTLMAIETKGEQLKNDDSRDKLELGGKWALMAGPGYRYCMVFECDAIDDANAYTLDGFRSELL